MTRDALINVCAQLQCNARSPAIYWLRLPASVHKLNITRACMFHCPLLLPSRTRLLPAPSDVKHVNWIFWNILMKHQYKNYIPTLFYPFSVSTHFHSGIFTQHAIESNWVQPHHFAWQYLLHKCISYVWHDCSLQISLLITSPIIDIKCIL